MHIRTCGFGLLQFSFQVRQVYLNMVIKATVCRAMQRQHATLYVLVSCMHTCKHANMQTCNHTPTNLHTYTPTHLQTYTPTHLHTYTHTHTNIPTCRYIQTPSTRTRSDTQRDANAQSFWAQAAPGNTSQASLPCIWLAPGAAFSQACARPLDERVLSEARNWSRKL